MRLLYHGTTLKVAEAILREGFRIDVKHIWNDVEEYVYFTHDFVIAASHAGCAAMVRFDDYPAVVVCKTDSPLVLRPFTMTHSLGRSSGTKQIKAVGPDDLGHIVPVRILAFTEKIRPRSS